MIRSTLSLSLSRPAQADLRGIRNWIKKENPVRAVTFVEELIARFSVLIEHPLIGRSHPEMGEDARVLVHGNFLIVYRPTDKQIIVSRVIDARRDLSRQFQ